MKPNNRRSNSKIWGRINTIIIVLILSVIAFTTIYPLYFTLNSSLKNQAEWSKSKFTLPIPPKMENFKTAWKRADVPRTFLNSLIVTIGGVAVCFVVCILSAFAATKLKFKGRNLIFILLLSSMMIPFQTILYPFFKTMNDFHLTNNYLGLILAFATFEIPITIYQYAAYLKRVPNELIEAARVDGASTMRIIFSIMLPVAKPVVFTAAMINFAWMWNEILLPIMLLQNPKMQTLIVSLASLRGQYGTFPTLISAGVFLGIIPVSLIYFAAQNQIIKGMTVGTVKG
ncbi:MAG: carbohydrate ABC transporter permease [Candidatus Humimicrobiaceae bacterium]